MRSVHVACWYRNRPQDAHKGRPARPQRAKWRIVLVRYGEPLRFTTRGITRVTFVNAAETVRRQCLARTPLADFFRILLVIAPCALDGLPVRLRRPYVRAASAGFRLKRLATAFMNNPG